MRVHVLCIITVMLASVACSPPQPKDSRLRRETDQRRDADQNSAARKAGHAAYGVAQETEKLAKEAGHKLREAGKNARQGWKDAERENRDKHR